MIDRDDVKALASVISAIFAATVLVIAAIVAVGAALGFAVRVFMHTSGLGS